MMLQCRTLMKVPRSSRLARAGWFGNAVSWRRKALNLTASELSRRTVELGYPISRGAVAKIESNLRSGKVDVVEVLVLSAALDIPPVLVAVPAVRHRRERGSASWCHRERGRGSAVADGPSPPPRESDMPSVQSVHIGTNLPNEGVQLVVSTNLLHQALETRISLVHHLHTLQAEDADVTDARRMLDMNDDLIQNLRQQIRDARETLWGMNPTISEAETEDDE